MSFSQESNKVYKEKQHKSVMEQDLEYRAMTQKDTPVKEPHFVSTIIGSLFFISVIVLIWSGIGLYKHKQGMFKFVAGSGLIIATIIYFGG